MIWSHTPGVGVAMSYFVGLNVSLEWTRVCVVDAEG